MDEKTPPETPQKPSVVAFPGRPGIRPATGKGEPTPSDVLEDLKRSIPHDAACMIVLWGTPDGQIGYSVDGTPATALWVVSQIHHLIVSGELYDTP